MHIGGGAAYCWGATWVAVRQLAKAPAGWGGLITLSIAMPAPTATATTRPVIASAAAGRIGRCSATGVADRVGASRRLGTGSNLMPCGRVMLQRRCVPPYKAVGRDEPPAQAVDIPRL